MGHLEDRWTATGNDSPGKNPPFSVAASHHCMSGCHQLCVKNALGQWETGMGMEGMMEEVKIRFSPN